MLLLLAWTLPIGRLATVFTLMLTAVLLASPSWFLHYPGLATGPLCVALYDARLGRPCSFSWWRPPSARAARWVHFTPGSRFPGVHRAELQKGALVSPPTTRQR